MLSWDSVGCNELEITSGCQSSWSGWKWNGATLSVNIFNTLIQDGGHKVGIKRHKVNTSYRLVTTGFHVPGARIATSGSHGPLSSGWMSLLIGPRLPLNQIPAPFTFLWVLTKFRGVSICSQTTVRTQWWNVSETTGQSCFSRSSAFLAYIWQCFFFLRTYRIGQLFHPQKIIYRNYTKIIEEFCTTTRILCMPAILFLSLLEKRSPLLVPK